MVFETINNILSNKILANVSCGLWIFYLAFGMILVAAMYDSWNDKKKTFFLCVIPFVLGFFAVGAVYNDLWRRIVFALVSALFLAPVFMGFYKNIDD